MQLNEHRVRERAYKILESEGKPEGCADKHWNMACQYEQESPDDQADPYSTLGDDVNQQSIIESKPKKKNKHSRH